MKKLIKYPKIGQFRQIVSDIVRETNYKRIENPLYISPTITFKGTVKLHGTNASVCYSDKSGIYYQSRNNIITPLKDNAGFSFFAECRKDIFQSFFEGIKAKEKIDTSKNTISIYGEWAGEGIQKGVAISKVPKSFYIFGVKISPDDDEKPAYWISEEGIRNDKNCIFNINDFMTWYIDINFENPSSSIPELIRITDEVEKQCPVSIVFGKEGIGEGVVWKGNYNNSSLKFKVKGQKHSVSKVKKIVSIDVDKLKSINEFIEYSVTENRFNQAIKEVFKEEDIVIQKLGDLIKWMLKDILEEEIDTLKENNLSLKDISSRVAQKTKEMFFKLQNENL